MPNLLNLLPNAVGQSAPQIVYGQVVDPAPTHFTDSLFVVMSDWSVDFPLQIDEWPAVNGSVLPIVGNDVFIAQDTLASGRRVRYRVIWWGAAATLWGGVTLPPSPPGLANEAILSDGSGGSAWRVPAAAGAAGGELNGNYPNPGLARDTAYAKALLSVNTAGFTASVWTRIPTATVADDPNGHINVANGWYVCPSAGVYQATGNIAMQQGPGGAGTLAGWVGDTSTPGTGTANNGMEIFGNPTVPASNVAIGNGSTTFRRNAGDIITLWGISNIAGAFALAAQWSTTLTVVKIG